MTKRFNKPELGRRQGDPVRSDAVRGIIVAARDPLAYAAALKILG